MASQLTIPATVPGRFGPYGGRYVPETLMVPLLELERAYELAKSDVAFEARFQDLLKNFAAARCAIFQSARQPVPPNIREFASFRAASSRKADAPLCW